MLGKSIGCRHYQCSIRASRLLIIMLLLLLRMTISNDFELSISWTHIAHNTHILEALAIHHRREGQKMLPSKPLKGRMNVLQARLLVLLLLDEDLLHDVICEDLGVSLSARLPRQMIIQVIMRSDWSDITVEIVLLLLYATVELIAVCCWSYGARSHKLLIWLSCH